MPRRKLIRTTVFAYHVVNRTIDKTHYPSANMDEIWDYACDLLKIVSWCFGAKIHGFVLMGNHYHLLISTPDGNLDDIIRYFQSRLSQAMSTSFGTQTLRFATRYKATLIDRPEYFANVYRYLYQNPLRAGMVKNVEDYPWSTLCGCYGGQKLEVPLAVQPFLSDLVPDRESGAELAWLNERVPSMRVDQIKRGLGKSVFKIGQRTRGVKLLPKGVGHLS